MPRPISVVYCFPRSGGTLLSQCLLCAKSTVVLSEVNPAGSFLAVERQAQEWFGLITPKEAAALAARPYLEKIALAARRCAKRRQRLCVRDWVAINFLPHLSPLVPVVSGVLEQRLFLRSAGYELREIALLRRSRDIFDSLRRHMPGFERYSPRLFARHYRAYLAAIADVPKFHLEDLTRKPDATLREICASLGLGFPAGFKAQFHAKVTVTGNNTLPTKPPSASSARITANRPKGRTVGAKSGRDRPMFAHLDALAGYQTGGAA